MPTSTSLCGEIPNCRGNLLVTFRGGSDDDWCLPLPAPRSHVAAEGDESRSSQ